MGRQSVRRIQVAWTSEPLVHLKFGSDAGTVGKHLVAFAGIINFCMLFSLFAVLVDAMLAQLTNRAQAVLSSAPMTVEQIIRSLGGPAVVGRYLGIRGQAVSHWIRLGRVPVDRVPGVLRLAKKQRTQLRAEQVRPDIDWAALK